jgi:hypothetical protein
MRTFVLGCFERPLILLILTCLISCPTGGASPISSGAPAILFTDVEAGPIQGGPNNLGVPIAIFGKGFGAQQNNSKVTINNLEVASYLVWGQNNAKNPALDMIVVQPGANVTAGSVVVTVAGTSSNSDLSFTPTAGTVYFVAPNGSDTDPCSQNLPCSSILHTVGDVMKPGDAVLVRGGQINDDEVWIRDVLGHSGTPNHPKIVRNYPAEQAVFQKANRPVILDANHITFSGFDFENGKSIGVGDIGSSGNRVINSSFRGDIAYDAIGTHGNNIVLAGNNCDVSSSSQGTQGHCYYISHGKDLRLLYNVAKGAPGYGIHIFDQQRSTTDFRRIIENVLVEGNLLTASPERSGMIVAMGDEGKIGNHIQSVVIRNNLFVGNNFAGIAIGGNVQDVRIEHNTFYANGRQGITIYNDASINNITVQNNLFDQSANTNCQQNCSWYQIAHLEKGASAQNVLLEHNFYAPGTANVLGTQDSSAQFGIAGFVNPQGLDFHLSDNSPAIDKGMVLPSVKRDFDGRARPMGNGFDPGAFEHP